MLLINQEIRDAIVRNSDKAEIRKLVFGNGNTITMLQDGLNKVVAGETTFEEIIKLIDLEDDLGEGSTIGLKDSLDNVENSNSVIETL